MKEPALKPDRHIVVPSDLQLIEAVAALKGRADALLALEGLAKPICLAYVVPEASHVTVEASACFIKGGSLAVLTMGAGPVKVVITGNRIEGGGIVIGDVAEGQIIGNSVSR